MKFTLVNVELSAIAEFGKYLKDYNGGLKYFYYLGKLYKVDNYVVVRTDDNATGLELRKVKINAISIPLANEPNYDLYDAFNLGGKLFLVKDLVYSDGKLVNFACSAGGKYEAVDDTFINVSEMKISKDKFKAVFNITINEENVVSSMV